MTGLVLDLFAGAGGWEEGLRLLDGPSAIGFELARDECATRGAAGHRTIRADVATWPLESMPDVDGLIGSPPCQAFSQAGKGHGRRAIAAMLEHVAACADGWLEPDVALCGDDVRADLTLQPLRWADALRPRWVALEQTPAVLPLWQAIAAVLRTWGYDARAWKLQAANYGVPQTRMRAVLVARRDGVPVRRPEPTHYNPKRHGLALFGEPWITMADALGWGMTHRPSTSVMATSQGGPRPLDGGSGHRATIQRERDAGRWVVAGGKHGEGHPRDAFEEPAPTITGKGTAYLLDDPSSWQPSDPEYARDKRATRDDGPSQSFREAHGDLLDAELEQPVWVNGNQPNAARRRADEPAPTVLFGHAANEVRIVRPRRNDQSGSGESDPNWHYDRPATTVAGRDLVADPGANANRYKGRAKSRNDGVRVTVEEAATLQTFPADYPWQGSRTAVFRQIGNAIPPMLAAVVLRPLLPSGHA